MNKLITLLLPAAALLASGFALAAPAEGRILRIDNPPQPYSVQIGDLLQRTVQIEFAPGYALSPSSLPVKGTRNDGIELVEVTVDQPQGDDTRYAVKLRYQVFAQASAPASKALPATKLAATGDGKMLTLAVPAWRFWFAPLVAMDNFKTARTSLQPSLGPVLVETESQRLGLAIYAALAVIGLIGLVYINADRRWLPFMGGPFARAHRRIKRLRHKPAQQKQALFHLHQAFNQTFGASVFIADIERFIERHPRFAGLKTQIAAFFERSNRALFAGDEQGMSAAELLALSRSLRDSERGV
jgi:mxaA protein